MVLQRHVAWKDGWNITAPVTSTTRKESTSLQPPMLAPKEMLC